MIAKCLTAGMQRASWVPRLAFSSTGQGVALGGQDRAFFERG